MTEFLIEGRTISQELERLAKQGNKPFSVSLHPGVEHILGVRIPDLRKLARKIANSDWTLYLSHVGLFYMEERILYGLVLGYITPDSDVETYLSRVTNFVHQINSWSVCDSFSFAGGKYWVEEHSIPLWNYLVRWMRAKGEYEKRFGIVMAKKYFIDDEHLDKFLMMMDEIRHEGYYVKMAVAWAVSECFVKFPQQTMIYLEQNHLDHFTYNMSLQKIIESYRVDDQMKLLIKNKKRK